MEESEVIKVRAKVGINTNYWAKNNNIILWKHQQWIDVHRVTRSRGLWQRGLPEWHERSSTSRQPGLPPLAKVCIALRHFTAFILFDIQSIWWETQSPWRFPVFWFILLRFSEEFYVRSLMIMRMNLLALSSLFYSFLSNKV